MYLLEYAKLDSIKVLSYNSNILMGLISCINKKSFNRGYILDKNKFKKYYTSYKDNYFKDIKISDNIDELYIECLKKNYKNVKNSFMLLLATSLEKDELNSLTLLIENNSKHSLALHKFKKSILYSLLSQFEILEKYLSIEKINYNELYETLYLFNFETPKKILKNIKLKESVFLKIIKDLHIPINFKHVRYLGVLLLVFLVVDGNKSIVESSEISNSGIYATSLNEYIGHDYADLNFSKEIDKRIRKINLGIDKKDIKPVKEQLKRETLLLASLSSDYSNFFGKEFNMGNNYLKEIEETSLFNKNKKSMSSDELYLAKNEYLNNGVNFFWKLSKIISEVRIWSIFSRVSHELAHASVAEQNGATITEININAGFGGNFVKFKNLDKEFRSHVAGAGIEAEKKLGEYMIASLKEDNVPNQIKALCALYSKSIGIQYIFQTKFGIIEGGYTNDIFNYSQETMTDVNKILIGSILGCFLDTDMLTLIPMALGKNIKFSDKTYKLTNGLYIQNLRLKAFSRLEGGGLSQGAEFSFRF